MILHARNNVTVIEKHFISIIQHTVNLLFQCSSKKENILKTTINSIIEENREVIYRIGDDLFQHPELGFKEIYTEEIICNYLDQLGITYQKHVAVHGVICTLGSENGYHIAVVADMDALLTSMDGVMAPFHSCGHSIQVAVLLNLIHAFYKGKVLEKLPGRVSFIFAPAEEFIDIEERQKLKDAGKIRFFSGKQNMIYEGIFDDIDLVLSCHVMGKDESNPEALFDINSTLAGFIRKEAVFRGQAAHAGVIPHLGRNALQAATLSLTAIQMLKDTFSPEAGAKVYPILKEGGKTANIICDYATIETYIRANRENDLVKINEQINQAIIHCSLALETTCEIQDMNGYLPLSQNRVINETVYQNMLTLCDDSKIIKNVVSGASGDIGDLSFLLPTIQFGFSGIQGNVHSNQFEIVDKKHVYEDTTKVLAGTITDLLSDVSLQIKNPDSKAKKEYYMKHWLKVEVSL